MPGLSTSTLPCSRLVSTPEVSHKEAWNLAPRRCLHLHPKGESIPTVVGAPRQVIYKEASAGSPGC